jgi:hypothetical protein
VDFQFPFTTARKADSSMSIIGDLVGTAVTAVQVPEYSPSRPVTVARQAPFHAWADLLADHRPRITILLEASYKAQEPVAPPLSRCASAVQLPRKFCPALDDALQEPRSSAPETKPAQQAKTAIRRAADMSFNLPTLLRFHPPQEQKNLRS